MGRNCAENHSLHTADESVWLDFTGESVPRVGETVSPRVYEDPDDPKSAPALFRVVSVKWFFFPTLVHAVGSVEHSRGDRSEQTHAAARVLIEPVKGG